jgi:hypothetical protein
MEQIKKCAKECTFRIFRDSELMGTGYLSFYCEHCLKLVKVKVRYAEVIE